MRYGWEPPINRFAGSNQEAFSAVSSRERVGIRTNLSLIERKEKIFLLFFELLFKMCRKNHSLVLFPVPYKK